MLKRRMFLGSLFSFPFLGSLLGKEKKVEVDGLIQVDDAVEKGFISREISLKLIGSNYNTLEPMIAVPPPKTK